MDDVIPIMSEGSLFRRNTVTDKYDKVYILQKNFITDDIGKKYKEGYLRNGYVIYDDTFKRRESSLPGNEDKYTRIKTWNNYSIDYKVFEQKQNEYISNPDIDIWIGSGYIDVSYSEIYNPPSYQDVATNSAASAGGSSMSSFNPASPNSNDPAIANNIKSITENIQRLQDQINFLTIFLKDKSELPQRISALRKTIDDLKSQLSYYSNMGGGSQSGGNSDGGGEVTTMSTTTRVEIDEYDVRYVYFVNAP
jgi:hypothetical protein